MFASIAVIGIAARALAARVGLVLLANANGGPSEAVLVRRSGTVRHWS